MKKHLAKLVSVLYIAIIICTNSGMLFAENESLELGQDFSSYRAKRENHLATRRILGELEGKLYFSLASQGFSAPSFPMLDQLAVYDLQEEKTEILKDFEGENISLFDACLVEDTLYYLLINFDELQAELYSLSQKAGEEPLMRIDVGYNWNLYPALIVRNNQLHILFIDDIQKEDGKKTASLYLLKYAASGKHTEVYEKAVSLPRVNAFESGLGPEKIYDDGGDKHIVFSLYDADNKASILLAYDGKDLKEIAVQGKVDSVHSSGDYILFTRDRGEEEFSWQVETSLYDLKEESFTELGFLPGLSAVKGLGEGYFLVSFQDEEGKVYIESLEISKSKEVKVDWQREADQPGYFVQGENNSMLFCQEKREGEVGSMTIVRCKRLAE